jgi:hypothetical protein
MEATSIDIYELYNDIVYEYYPETKILRLTWDKTNTSLHTLMKKERLPYQSELKYNALWVGELKRCVNWEEGKELKIVIKDISKCHDNEFIIQVLDDVCHSAFIYEMIDKEGYLRVRNYGIKRCIHNYEEYMKRVNCVYNEIVEQENQLYILK